jgi:hypothetical protein
MIMRGYTFLLWGLLALLALYLFFTLGGREYFNASTKPKNASLWQDSTGGWTAYWEPPDTDNTYSYNLFMSDGTTYSIAPTTKPYQTYLLGQRDPAGFVGSVGLTDVATNNTSGRVMMKNISAAAGKKLIDAASGVATTTTTTATSALGTTPAAAAPAVSATAPVNSTSTQAVTTVMPNFSATPAMGKSALISGIAGLLLSPESTTIITTGQIPIGDVGQDTQIYEYNNGYAAFAVSANLFGDSINKLKSDIQMNGNEYNVSVISDNGINYTFPLDQITSVTSSTNGEVVAYNLLNTTYPKGSNMFTGNGARTVGLEITLVGPSGSSGASIKDMNPLTSSISAPNPLDTSIGATLNAPTNAPTYGPAGVGGGGGSGGGCGLNGTIPPFSPCQGGSGSGSGAGGMSNLVPKSSLVPCSCATSGSASCSVHQGSTCGSTVPGQPGSSCTDPRDTISSLTKAQRQWDLMKPFNTNMGDVQGFLNSFSAFG